MLYFKPQSPDPFIKKPEDMTIARFGHLKVIVNAIDALEDAAPLAEDFTYTANTFTALSGSTIKTNTIAETTAASGVTIDGVLVKDSAITLADGTVSNLSVKIGADGNNGLYGVSDTQVGIAVEGALVAGADTSGLFTGNIAEQVAAAGVTVDGVLARDGYVINKPTPVAIDTTATASAAQILSGYITSTSAAAVAITTPTATALAAVIGAVAGTSFDFVIDNSAGANTVTLTLDASIAVTTPAVTGGDTLTVSTANAIGVFRIIFTSGTTAKIFRIA